MELLPLPNFHHILMATILIALLLVPSLLIAAFVKKRKHSKKTKPPKDIYELSIALQEIAPDNKNVQQLLDEAASYKYNPHAPKVPKELYKKMVKLYNRFKK